MRTLIENLVTKEPRELNNYIYNTISDGGIDMWFDYLHKNNKISTIVPLTRENYKELTRFSLFIYIRDLHFLLEQEVVDE
jgi:hypothetical protein